MSEPKDSLSRADELTPMRLVLMTSGLNDIARALPSLPAKPIGIIEVLSGPAEASWRIRTRRVLRKLQGRPYADLGQFCTHHELQHVCLDKRDTVGIDETLAEWQTDLVLTCGCPLLSVDCFESLGVGAINLHDAMLPAYRGGNPLFWQVLDQVDDVGASVHFIDAGIDTGAVLGQRSMRRPTAISRSRLQYRIEQELGVPLLHEVVSRLGEGDFSAIAQPAVSETRAAKHLSAKQMADLLYQESPSLRALWDLAHYWGHWPASLGRYRGWRSHCRWVPLTMDLATEPRAGGERRTDLSAHPAEKPWIMEVRHAEGRLTLGPSIHARF